MATAVPETDDNSQTVASGDTGMGMSMSTSMRPMQIGASVDPRKRKKKDNDY